MREINIGAQGFADLREHNDFYIDKTSFIKEWWENRDTVTLITRPRRFGKTLNMDMLNCFFSNRYAGRGDLFEGLEIWKDEKYRNLQGTFPVIYLSFGDVKEATYREARAKIIIIIQRLFTRFKRFWAADSEERKRDYAFLDLKTDAGDAEVDSSLQLLSDYLQHRYQKGVLILLDEYDTPLQEAYLNGYWDQMSGFTSSLFNATFKTNPALGRALLTGITRTGRESIFSDLNNPNVVTTTTEQYETGFGFTQEEVWAALREFGLYDQREKVKAWYDGFTFGRRSDIYNPWSITNYLKRRKFDAYWVNSSDNRLVSYLVQTGSPELKSMTEELLDGECIRAAIDETIVFDRLDSDPDAVWSLLLAAGYLRFVSMDEPEDDFESPGYVLRLTNREVRRMFAQMIRTWFKPAGGANDGFVQAMIRGDAKSMNAYMNSIALATFSSFDSGTDPSPAAAPERFYHGFVLGLLVTQRQNYRVLSNRESGLGRYDVCMYPQRPSLPGIIMEFKVQDEDAGEKTLKTAAANALRQIREKRYAADLESQGVSSIYAYGFAFSGKKVLIRREGETEEKAEEIPGSSGTGTGYKGKC